MFGTEATISVLAYDRAPTDHPADYQTLKLLGSRPGGMARQGVLSCHLLRAKVRDGMYFSNRYRPQPNLSFLPHTSGPLLARFRASLKMRATGFVVYTPAMARSSQGHWPLVRIRSICLPRDKHRLISMNGK